MNTKRHHPDAIPLDRAKTTPSSAGRPGAAPAGKTGRGTKGHKKPHDPDAAWGYKTSKNGENELFYGYHGHAVVQVPEGHDHAGAEPRLIRRLELTPANEDLVDVSLSLLRRIEHPAPKTLIADRAYHHKRPERWRDELATRGIDAVLDLRADEHGFTDLNHTRWAAGWPHCPATPDDLGTISRPPSSPDSAAQQAFRNRIATRQAYAFRRVTTPTKNGTARWECPAIAGTVGCPLRPGTVEAAVELGLPVIQNPPDPNAPDFPTCCAQRTVTLDPGPLRKLMQRDYWGSDAWLREWNKRTYVEGAYGNLKNPSTENVRRGHFRVTGLPNVTIVAALAAAAYDRRILLNWAKHNKRTDPDHPLLRPAKNNQVWNPIPTQHPATPGEAPEAPHLVTDSP